MIHFDITYFLREADNSTYVQSSYRTQESAAGWWRLKAQVVGLTRSNSNLSTSELQFGHLSQLYGQVRYCQPFGLLSSGSHSIHTELDGEKSVLIKRVRYQERSTCGHFGLGCTRTIRHHIPTMLDRVIWLEGNWHSKLIHVPVCVHMHAGTVFDLTNIVKLGTYHGVFSVPKLEASHEEIGVAL